MKKLKSPFTVRLLDILTDLENHYVCMVMDFYANGNLETFSDNPNICDSQIISMFIEVLQGLIYLKDNQIIHGNLKTQSILLSSSNSPALVDFGFSN